MGKMNNLDERQEQVLLKIEHNGCWFAFWGLLAALMIQQILGADLRSVAGEWIVFFALAVYIAGACLKNGIWDRHLKSDTRTNLIVSLIAGAAFGVITFLSVLRRMPDRPVGSACAGLVTGVICFALCAGALAVMTKAYEARRKRLEDETEE